MGAGRAPAGRARAGDRSRQTRIHRSAAALRPDWHLSATTSSAAAAALTATMTHDDSGVFLLALYRAAHRWRTRRWRGGFKAAVRRPSH